MRDEDVGPSVTSAGQSISETMYSNNGATRSRHAPPRPTTQRRSSASPHLQSDILSAVELPTSSTSTRESPNVCRLITRLQQPSVHMRSHSSSPVPTHRRHGSDVTVDPSTLKRYGYPTYRRLTSFITAEDFLTIPDDSGAIRSRESSVGSAATTVSTRPSQACTPCQPQELAAHREQSNGSRYPATTTLRDFLSLPNPAPGLCSMTDKGSKISDSHFWFDIRNLREWDGFSLEFIDRSPGLQRLLEVRIPEASMPESNGTPLLPESENSLQDIYTAHLRCKVNAALRFTPGDRKMTIYTSKPHADGFSMAHFVSSYQEDPGQTIRGDCRSRVVGLAKSSKTWNTGMRTDGPIKQVEYLRGLAHIHRQMREHRCRYGFIITDVELVVVRAGTELIPHFGFLELAPAISPRACGRSRMTACLALWYLHMLAGEVFATATATAGHGQPLSSRLEIGCPKTLSRKKHLERDSWIPKPQLHEMRLAKELGAGPCQTSRSAGRSALDGRSG